LRSHKSRHSPAWAPQVYDQRAHTFHAAEAWLSSSHVGESRLATVLAWPMPSLTRAKVASYIPSLA
ncbi:MAG: hypothetical protein WCL44_03650, partial [bacterium]